MLRRVRLLAVALACAAGGVIALPAGGAGAVAAAPTAIITSDPPLQPNGNAPCPEGHWALLSGESSIDAVNYDWSWEGGGESGPDKKSVIFSCFLYNSPLKVTLTVTNAAGQTDTTSVILEQNLLPVVSITSGGQPVGDNIDAPWGSEVVLSGAGSYDPEQGPLIYEWWASSYYLPGPIDEPIVTFTCDQSTIFLTLTVTENTGYEAYQSVSVNCVTAPAATFTPAPAPDGKRKMVALGTKITFKPTAADGSNEWAWRTTGVTGVASSSYEYTRTFDKPGDYGVELTATNQGGAAKLWSGFTVVGPPTVSVTPAPPGMTERMTIPTGTKITFDGSGSRSPGGPSLAYEWRTTGVPAVAGTSTSYTRSFNAAGQFGVELTVVDALGQRAKRWVGFNVVPAAPPVVKVTPASADPKARTKVKLGKTITFDSNGSIDPDGGALTYQWRTTGVAGVAGSAKTYTRKFDKLGDFGVELTVIDNEGQVAKRWVGFTVER